jgi:hypothetical protein
MLRRSRADRVAAPTRGRIGLGLCLLVLFGCGKDKPAPPLDLPLPRGAASSDELSTGLGQARGLPEGLAPSSTKWTRIFVVDDRHAVLTGDVTNETIALSTDDAGRSWRSLRNEREGWANWAVGADGTIVLAVGTRNGARAVGDGTVESTRLLFGAVDAALLTAPMPLFPQQNGPAKGLLQTGAAIPAVLAPDSAALIAEERPRRPVIFYGGKPGVDAFPLLNLPPTEKLIPVPYGRPPMLLSVRGRDLMARPFPNAGKSLEKPNKIPGLVSTTTLVAELAASPACEASEWSFQKIKQPPGRLHLLGISSSRVVTFPLPDTTAPGTYVGCGAAHIVVETLDPNTRSSQLATCDLAGKCVSAQNAPFRIWAEQHEREIMSTHTEQGTVSLHASRTADRWGLYLAQSADGAVYERPRVIGEGTGDRGRLEPGALISFGKRLLLLLSADVTGTSRRGWFVIISDDGGSNWNPP